MKTKHLIIGLFAADLTFTSCSEDEGVDFDTDNTRSISKRIINR